MPPVRRFGRVRLVAEEVCAAPVQKLLLQKHWRHLQAEIVLVPEWNPAHVESVLSSLASDENTLLALVPSWLTPASVTCHFPNASGVPVFKAKPSLGPRLPGVEDAEKGIEVIKTFMRAIEASATDCVSVVLLPALPLHCSFDGFFTTVAEAVLPPALLLLEVAQVMCRRVFASYRSFSNAICLEALASFTKESLQCNALLALIEKTKDLSLSCKSKASGSQNVYTSELYSQGNSLPDVTAILFGLFCRTLHEMIFTATSAYPFQPLPDIEELNFCGTYPELSHLADLSSKSRRFKKVIIVGDAAARSKISEELGGKERIQLLPTPLFSDSSILELLELLSLEPPNVLVLFLLDVTLFAVKEVYPDCLTKKCSDKILRCHLSSSVDWEDDAAVQTLVASKLESIISYLQQMKQCLPHQSNVLLLPVAPERLLLQTEAKSFWNHTLLHATFWLPSSGNAMAYGDLKHWNVLYHTLAQELNKPQYQIDPGMSALLTPLRKDLEPQLSYSSNPRLYVEDQFTERMQWRQLCKDLLNKAFKLVFPVVGILEEDLNKADAIMNTKNPEWEIKLEEADSHVPPPENSTSSYTGPSSVGHSPPASSPISNRVSPTPISTKEFESTGSSGFLGEPREVVIESGYAELPLSFVQALLVPFEPLTEITRVEPRSYRVALPDTIRTALLVALLHNFRCCFVHITVSVLDFEGQTLPQCPSREKFRLQQLLMPKLKLFASSCDNKYSQNIKIDDAFLKSREEEHDYVEGLDATLPYLHRELQYLHFHHQQSIRDGKVLVIVVTSTAEDAGILHFTLAGSLQDSARFPVGPGTASLSFVTRDSKQTADSGAQPTALYNEATTLGGTLSTLRFRSQNLLDSSSGSTSSRLTIPIVLVTKPIHYARAHALVVEILQEVHIVVRPNYFTLVLLNICIETHPCVIYPVGLLNGPLSPQTLTPSKAGQKEIFYSGSRKHIHCRLGAERSLWIGTEEL
ncbi:hypothetical protein FHG87_006440 [Trinorchestia longiramus]|nr:hypothetical protein FHG87_006440 [Trinorchestia longiramus]